MPANIVLGGDSAGGNLVLATLHRIKAAGEPMPRCAVLLSPFVDFTLSSISLIRNEASDPMFTFAKLAAIRPLYASPERFLDPSLSPLFGDFAGLPPLLFQASGDEMPCSTNQRGPRRARTPPVFTVEFEIWDGWCTCSRRCRCRRRSVPIERIIDFIRRQTRMVMRTAVFAFTTMLAACAISNPAAGGLEGTVETVLSGDTLVVRIDGKKVEVRLADIGAPQGSQFYAPNVENPSGGDGRRPLGDRARNRARRRFHLCLRACR